MNTELIVNRILAAVQVIMGILVLFVAATHHGEGDYLLTLIGAMLLSLGIAKNLHLDGSLPWQ